MLTPVVSVLVVSLLACAVAGSVAYLLALLAGAALAGRRTPTAANADPTAGLRLTVVIPAHNEEMVLDATLASLEGQDYPGGLYSVCVVADNCSDRTAEIASRAGARVMERTNLEERGKGYALAWAMGQFLEETECPDAFVFVDADTWVAPDFLRLMAAQLAARADNQGRCALQGRYGVLNRNEGWRASLMLAAFELANHIRPLGTDRLGGSVGLKGNGMAFTTPVMREAAWTGDSITEDIDFGLDLLQLHGVRVGYVPEACVLAQMPVTAKQAASQRERWERGRYTLLRARFVPLLAAACRRRDFRLVECALSLLVPPLAELAGLLLLWSTCVTVGGLSGWLPGLAAWAAACGAVGAGLVVYVLLGLRLAGAPASAYAALLRAPFYALWKFALYGWCMLKRAGQRGGQAEWVRTDRAAIPARGAAGEPAVAVEGMEP